MGEVGYIPARGGKRMAIKPRKISGEHILDSLLLYRFVLKLQSACKGNERGMLCFKKKGLGGLVNVESSA